MKLYQHCVSVTDVIQGEDQEFDVQYAPTQLCSLPSTQNGPECGHLSVRC